MYTSLVVHTCAHSHPLRNSCSDCKDITNTRKIENPIKLVLCFIVVETSKKFAYNKFREKQQISGLKLSGRKLEVVKVAVKGQHEGFI